MTQHEVDEQKAEEYLNKVYDKEQGFSSGDICEAFLAGVASERERSKGLVGALAIINEMTVQDSVIDITEEALKDYQGKE